MKSAALLLVAAITIPACRAAVSDCHDGDHRALLQAKLSVFGVGCEDMCKRLGDYPNCQCPGFAGQPAEDGDTRACMDKHCQDPNQPCPSDPFVTCVKETTKVAALQWDDLMKRVDSQLGLFQKALGRVRNSGRAAASDNATSCQVRSHDHLVLVQARVGMFGIDCEEMCKKLNAYPDGCQCPGFEGEPAGEDDTRACYVKNCQDPDNHCPTDAFVTCVKTTSKFSALQLPAMLQSLDLYEKNFKALAAAHRARKELH